MAFGDTGGSHTELMITCRTVATGPVSIKAGDALVLAGDYVVEHATGFGQAVFGQAVRDCDQNDAAIPVRVKGVFSLRYSGIAPAIRGLVGVVTGREPGSVTIKPGGYEGQERGIVMKVYEAIRTVDVLF